MSEPNPFVKIVAEAAAKGWCVKLFCTTCAASEYRRALRRLAGTTGAPLLEALCDVPVEELLELPNWQEALEVAVHDLWLGGQADTILTAWLSRVGKHVRFDDAVLYRLVRALPAGNALRESWIDATVPEAMAKIDHSLVESLLLVLGPRAHRFPELLDVARQLATHSAQMHRVVRNVDLLQLASVNRSDERP